MLYITGVCVVKLPIDILKNGLFKVKLESIDIHVTFLFNSLHQVALP